MKKKKIIIISFVIALIVIAFIFVLLNKKNGKEVVFCTITKTGTVTTVFNYTYTKEKENTITDYELIMTSSSKEELEKYSTVLKLMYKRSKMEIGENKVTMTMRQILSNDKIDLEHDIQIKKDNGFTCTNK